MLILHVLQNDSIQMPINGLMRYGIGLVLFTNINALEVTIHWLIISKAGDCLNA